jgi:RNA polymerase sigma factor (sigma-70 family)
VLPIDSGNHRQAFLARRDALIAEHIPMVKPIALGVHAKLPPCFDLDDLLATGLYHLTRAAIRYRPERGTPFKQFAWKQIRGGIIDSVRHKQYRECTRPPLDSDSEPCATPDHDSAIDESRRSGSMALAIDCLPERERKLITLYYYGGGEQTLAAVGREMGFSIATAKRVHAQARRALRVLLRA